MKSRDLSGLTGPQASVASRTMASTRAKRSGESRVGAKEASISVETKPRSSGMNETYQRAMTAVGRSVGATVFTSLGRVGMAVP